MRLPANPAALVTAFLLTTIAPAQAAQPNVVVIMVDNLGWGELGCYGGGVLRICKTLQAPGVA